MKKKFILVLFLFFISSGVYCQSIFEAVIKDNSDMQPMPGCIVQVKGTTNGSIADANGMVNLAVPDGEQTIICSFSGYKKWKQKFVFPLENMESLTILLKPKK